jgi:hypothetical protein
MPSVTDSMPSITLVYGLLLIALGAYYYVATGQASVTALIPAFFGVVILILAILARRPGLLKHVMHAAAALALLAFLGGVSGLIKVLGGDAGNAAREQALMAVVSLVFVALAVRSFIEARRARAATAAAPR